MERLNAEMRKKPRLPVKALQFGEGNFLRGFADYMLDIANEKGGAGSGNVVLVKPTALRQRWRRSTPQDCLLHRAAARAWWTGKAAESMSRG